jgi:hypothetical protein
MDARPDLSFGVKSANFMKNRKRSVMPMSASLLEIGPAGFHKSHDRAGGIAQSMNELQRGIKVMFLRAVRA